MTYNILWVKYTHELNITYRGKSPITDPYMIICNNLFNIKYIYFKFCN